MNSAGIKAKGRDAENRVADYFQLRFPYYIIERRRLTGAQDRGDLTGLPGVVIEIKAHNSLDLAGWLKELAAEIQNDGASTGAVIHKKRGTLDVGEWYVTMPVHLYAGLLAAALCWTDEYGPSVLEGRE